MDVSCQLHAVAAIPPSAGSILYPWYWSGILVKNSVAPAWTGYSIVLSQWYLISHNPVPASFERLWDLRISVIPLGRRYIGNGFWSSLVYPKWDFRCLRGGMKITVFWGVAPCSLVEVQWRCVGAWIGLICLRVGTGGGLFWTRSWIIGFHKGWGICWLAGLVSASEVELVGCGVFYNTRISVVWLLVRG
jgi:hypothetical protein